MFDSTSNIAPNKRLKARDSAKRCPLAGRYAVKLKASYETLIPDFQVWIRFGFYLYNLHLENHL